jgi:hypothetical protein
MKILIAGGSGFVGRFLCWRLAELGHEPTVLTRRAAPGASPSPRQVAWDGRTASGDWLAAAAECPAWINLCGAGIADARWTRARKRVLQESRLLPTKALVEAVGKVAAKPKVLINASAVGYYGETGDRSADESFSYGGGFLPGLCALWEHEAMQAAPLGVRPVCLRLGVVLGADGGMLARLVPLFRLGLGGPLGSGRQWLSWIAREDLAGLIAHLLTADVSGGVNAASPHPVTNRVFSQTLGRVLGRPAWLKVPSLALRLVLGEMADVLLQGQRTAPKKALASGFVFTQPDLEMALRDELG